MKKILLLGAGRSTFSLVQYLLEQSGKMDWVLRVGDQDLAIVEEKIAGNERAEGFVFDVHNPTQLEQEIEAADVVISMLPARFHWLVAQTCLEKGKSLMTASYVNEDLKKIDAEVKSKGLLFLNEIGLDPGLDHLSAMKLIDRVKSEGYFLHTFESFTGGLVAPESDDNPWNYKFTWNPRNVVVAGQGGTVKFIQEGRYKYIPYNRLFRRTEIIEIEDYGRFEGYANRDSLKYIDIYGLHGIPTIYRGTLRRPGFCRAWDVFVKIGATDDSYTIEDSENMTYREFINSFLAYNPSDSVELKLMHYLHLDQDSEIMEKLRWLGIFEDQKIGLKNATPAQILQRILEQKWTLKEEDKDMIVMWHKLIYEKENQKYFLSSSMVVKGDNRQQTAMAKTVGLPLGIATKLFLQGKILDKGVVIPTKPSIYEPVLAELKSYGIDFKESDRVHEGSL